MFRYLALAAVPITAAAPIVLPYLKAFTDAVLSL